jgi:nitrate/nitrite-specific signal transduction histidine kinase
MNNLNKISIKIKLLGALLIFLMLSAVTTTIYLNQQNIKDSLVVNIVGKQRMLTQKIAKNIFYINYSKSTDFHQLDQATQEFISTIKTLCNGDLKNGIPPAPTQEIETQLKKVKYLWQDYYENIQNFKHYTLLKEHKLTKTIEQIHQTNITLLNAVDKLVTMYTIHSEKKTEYIRTFQYSVALVFILIFIYSLNKLRAIEEHVNNFMTHSKEILVDRCCDRLQPIELQNESEMEIVEVSDTINTFISKVNSAMDHSNEALLQSQQASQKLEELTHEFDTILDELEDKSTTQKHLNNSEDIVIQSSEELINSTLKLKILKQELEKLTKSCQEMKT